MAEALDPEDAAEIDLDAHDWALRMIIAVLDPAQRRALEAQAAVLDRWLAAEATRPLSPPATREWQLVRRVASLLAADRPSDADALLDEQGGHSPWAPR